MRINYQFWNFLKNLFELLNQSGVSMIIAESSTDANPGLQINVNYSNKSNCKLNFRFQISTMLVAVFLIADTTKKMVDKKFFELSVPLTIVSKLWARS